MAQPPAGFRPARVCAFETIRLRALAGVPAAFSSTYANEATQPESFWHSRAAQESAGETVATCIAECANEWAGLALGVLGEHVPEGRTVTLAGMWADPMVRGRRVGAVLVAAVAASAPTPAATQLDLWVTAANVHAIALYTRCGFQPTGEITPLAHRHDLQEMRMWQTLAPPRV